MPKFDNETLMLVFVAVTGLAVLLQAVILVAIAATLGKAVRSIKEESEEFRASVMPVLENTRDLLAVSRDLFNRVAPKVESAAGDLAEITRNLRAQSADLESSTHEILARVRNQSGRLDGMLSSVLDAVDRAGNFVTDVVSRPVRQFSGIVASVKAAVETLGRRSSEGRPTHSSDHDSFI